MFLSTLSLTYGVLRYAVVGQTSNRLLDPTALLPVMINVDCLIHGVLQFACGFGWIWTMLKREQIRARFAIPGTPLNDYCISY
ncbi:hypothetical protein ANO14919_107180 [Xylariales sp. No.14919]|nr:hypothetical protein ANO14919_107180 [Xylariales sp. No.14919]